MTQEELRDKLHEMGLDATVFFENSDYNTAVIGLSSEDSLIYDYDKMVEYLMETDGMSADDAEDWISYNTIRAIPYCRVGHKPIVMYSMTCEDLPYEVDDVKYGASIIGITHDDKIVYDAAILRELYKKDTGEDIDVGDMPDILGVVAYEGEGHEPVILEQYF